MKIKICGIKTLEEAQIMNEFLPDFAGFIFAKSKRQVSFENARKIKAVLSKKIKTAGVFVDEKIENILPLKSLIDVVQFHGNYTEDDIEKANLAGFETIKVVRAKEKSYDIKTKASYVLFDTFVENQKGGTNKTFDWNIKIKTNVPFFAAGGINEENVEEAIKKLRPYGVDVSSGVEENGFKTRKKVSNIIEIIRRINL